MRRAIVQGRVSWLVLAVCLLAGMSAQAWATPFFDWEAPPAATPAPYVGMPSLDNNAASAAAVAAYWAAHPSDPKALRIATDLTDPACIALFRNNTVSYVFADFEGLSVATHLANLTSIVRWNPTANGGVGGFTPSASAYVGNYQVAPVYPNSTSPSPFTGMTATGYYNTNVNAAMEALYPGALTYRGPGALNGGSSSPNIRSNCFTLPVVQFTETAVNLQGTLFQFRPAPLPLQDAHIPIVARFNNWGNPGMSNSSSAQYPFMLDTSIAGYHDQLLARGDFAAMIAHYRARGANTYSLFQPGVVGYTKAQMQSDAQVGWSVWDALTVGGRTVMPATFDTSGVIDGTSQTFEQTGVVYSGMYQTHTTNPLGTDILGILVSNLDSKNHTVSFNQTINGATFDSGNTFTIEAGVHRLLEFTKVGGFWDLAENSYVSGTDSAGNSFWPSLDRNGIGVPEPAAIGLLALAGLSLLRRRR